MMHLSLEQDFDVSWGRNSQGYVTFTVSGEVVGDSVQGLKAEGHFESERTGRDVRFDLSDLSEHQRMTCAELLLDEAERHERWARRAAAAPMADAGTTWRQR